jgi:hypothetical protein
MGSSTQGAEPPQCPVLGPVVIRLRHDGHHVLDLALQRSGAWTSSPTSSAPGKSPRPELQISLSDVIAAGLMRCLLST